MPSTVHYKGSLYFGSNAELGEVMRLIEKEASQPFLKVDEADKKLTIEVSGPFEKREALQEAFSKAATYAANGMVLGYNNDTFADVFCAGRNDTFSADRPGAIVFTLQEFESTFGKLDLDIAKVVYDSPFYIYDISLKKVAMKFPDEDPITDEDCDIGFAALKTIWADHVAKSDTFAFPMLFNVLDEGEEVYSVQPHYGFAPGYTFEEVIGEARKKNFLVFRWSDFWDNNYTIND
jgi:hypothetical protein